MGTYTLEKSPFFAFTALIPDPEQKVKKEVVDRAVYKSNVNQGRVEHCFRNASNTVITGTWPNDKEHILRVILEELADKV